MTGDNIFGLRPYEPLWHDAEAVATIYQNLGTVTAQQVVTRAMAELAATMASIAESIEYHQLALLPRHLRRLQSLAENLGMLSLAQVAEDLRGCLPREDGTTFAAIWARLERVAEATFAAEDGARDHFQH